MHDNYHIEEPIGDESVTIHLDHHIGSKSLTSFYRTIGKWNSKLINYHQYCQLFKGNQLKCYKPPQLLYRASRDGFLHTEFHKCCDDHLGIVIIVKSKEGDLFGGYTKENVKPIDEGESNIRDEESFTFRFEDDRLYIFRLQPEHMDHALYRYHSTYLFAFGYCFWIASDADTYNLSSSHCDTASIILPECKLPVTDLPRRYFGGFDFMVQDLEVYKIVE